MKTNTFVQNLIAKYKSQFVPVRDTKLGIYIPTGDIAKAVKVDGSYSNPEEYRVFLNGELTTVPASLVTTSIPVYRINKPLDQLREGDIIRTGDEKKFTYRRVTRVDGNNIIADSFGGASGGKVTAIKDLFMDAKTVSVAVNMMSGFNLQGQGGVLQNPMLLAMLNDEDTDSGLEAMIMMNMFGNQGGNTNNLLPLLLMKDGDIDAKTLMMMQAMQNQGNSQINSLLPFLLTKGGDTDTFLMMAMMGGNNPFANLFGTISVAPVVANPVAAAPEVVTDEHAADDAEVADDQSEAVAKA